MIGIIHVYIHTYIHYHFMSCSSESSLSLASADIVQMEGENCVLSLIQLKFATSDIFSLEIRMTKLLLCNFSLWADASFFFLNSLMSVILTVRVYLCMYVYIVYIVHTLVYPYVCIINTRMHILCVRLTYVRMYVCMYL